MGFPYNSIGKESTCNAGDPVSIPGLGRSPGEGNSNHIQCSCLENPIDRRAWQATVHGVARVGHDLATKPQWPERNCKAVYYGSREGWRQRELVLCTLKNTGNFKLS